MLLTQHIKIYWDKACSGAPYSIIRNQIDKAYSLPKGFFDYNPHGIADCAVRYRYCWHRGPIPARKQFDYENGGDIDLDELAMTLKPNEYGRIIYKQIAVLYQITKKCITLSMMGVITKALN